MEVFQDASWQGPKVSDTKLSFVSSWECPFAQRVWIGLLEKNLEFDKHEINLRDEEGQYAPHQREGWVMRLNPGGKVPILCLRHGDTIHSAYESTVCNELLEDLQPAPALWPDSGRPEDGWLKARGRMIITTFDSSFLPSYYGMLLRQTEEAQQECRQRLAGVLEWLDSQADPEGPFFLGKQFTLVDAALAPFFLRLPVLKHYRGFELPQDCVKLRDWGDTIKQHKSVAATCVSPKPDMNFDQYLEWVYERYATGDAKSTSAADYR
jgi:glutathione S-transferase